MFALLTIRLRTVPADETTSWLVRRLKVRVMVVYLAPLPVVALALRVPTQLTRLGPSLVLVTVLVTVCLVFRVDGTMTLRVLVDTVNFIILVRTLVFWVAVRL